MRFRIGGGFVAFRRFLLYDFRLAILDTLVPGLLG
jgi:hypothetical protein